MLLHIIKNILLHDSRIFAVLWEGILSAVLFLYDSAYPCVNRDAGHPAVGKEHHAVCHFIPDAPYLLKH